MPICVSLVDMLVYQLWAVCTSIMHNVSPTLILGECARYIYTIDIFTKTQILSKLYVMCDMVYSHKTFTADTQPRCSSEDRDQKCALVIFIYSLCVKFCCVFNNKKKEKIRQNESAVYSWTISVHTCWRRGSSWNMLFINGQQCCLWIGHRSN